MIGHNLATPPGNEYEKNVFGPAVCLPTTPNLKVFYTDMGTTQAAEKNIEVCRNLIDMVNIDRTIKKMPPRDIKIAFDEVSSHKNTRLSALSTISHECYAD
jgi:hypothetical protein